ncbi:hypothetical protein PGRAT_05295 [Paenibacillus graminis]|uniref:Uncharacterized protein n=1 Tax=Paenibacillus graminis TaxID=189425 RepID=A0A089M6H1_9BACL|nr:hypothetical protein PGRAT_05295 [Paenibacillus graminis]
MKAAVLQAPDFIHLHMFRILTPRRIETFTKKAGLLAYASLLLLAFPSFQPDSGRSKSRSAFTVAGPRRICTVLPF